VSDAQINKLFSMMQRLNEQVDALKRIVERISQNSDAVLVDSVLAVISQHGTAIEHMTRVFEKLSIRCPQLRPETNEFPKVEPVDG